MRFITKNTQLILFAGLLLILAPYLYLSQFVNPTADDINYACNTLDLDWCCAFWNEYCKWSGSYSGNALLLLNNYFLYHDFVYQLFPVITFGLTWFSYFFFISSLAGNTIKFFAKTNLSLLLTMLFVFIMPTVAQGFFWMTGILAYQLANVITLLQVTFTINFIQKKYFVNKYFHLLVAVALLAVAIGFSEVIMLMLISFYVLLFVFAPAEKASRIYFLAFSVISLGLFLFVYLAPGTKAREAMFPSTHEFFKSAAFTFIQTFRFLFDWISNLPLLSFTFLAIPFGKMLSRKNPFLEKLLSIHPLFYATSIVLVMFICIFPPYWFTGILGQHRTINAACFFFLPLWFLHVLAWSVHLKNSFQRFNKKFASVLIIFSLAAMAATKNGYGAFTDIVYGKAGKYDDEMADRWNFLKMAQESKAETAELKAIENRPKTLFVLDVSEDKTYFFNQGYARYFGLESVTLKSSK